ncbi:hypothetical protein A3Q56_05352 [Intoshia linei]|uniref:Uncharacterized protein n=1 Tax=Intoshia linei TaxID=1819745 RepID=A0A177AY71_9BILA|nr:hypothetical protein A3Q56_05352 [Intoshia linei]
MPDLISEVVGDPSLIETTILKYWSYGREHLNRWKFINNIGKVDTVIQDIMGRNEIGHHTLIDIVFGHSKDVEEVDMYVPTREDLAWLCNDNRLFTRMAD